ncbi:prothoracicotropic hormone-like [Pectinophora gossypiella]|uniref:prothoracicotropic hormone-like n=1 Tax=Pectinophora gossypiella TaxID=13191 RepID=UPI00214F5EC9|nr:prothoracicotropic hormone-like [Pectinophora gossypiella]
MITRTFIVILACCSYLFAIQIVPRTLAIRITPNVDEFMIENQRTRTRTRQNYVVQALDDDISANLDNLVPAPVAEAFEPETNPEELTAQIVDYANMIRNDIIFLDNSVETTTRKRGNIKKKNYGTPDPPCNCESERDVINLGDNYYPTRVENRKCLEGSCPPPYHCKPNYYSITVLKLKRSLLRKEESTVALPSDFHHRWVAHKMNVTTSCVCAKKNDEN